MQYRKYTVNIRFPDVWPFRRKKVPWITENQIEVIDRIAKAGANGIPIFGTDIHLATIRALMNRKFIDTKRGGRVVITRLGKRRRRQPCPRSRVQVGSGYQPDPGPRRDPPGDE